GGDGEERQRPVQGGDERRREDSDQSEVSAERRPEGAPRPGGPQDDGIDDLGAVSRMSCSPDERQRHPGPAFPDFAYARPGYVCMIAANRPNTACSCVPGSSRGRPSTGACDTNRAMLATVSSSGTGLPALSLPPTAAIVSLRRSSTSTADRVW